MTHAKQPVENHAPSAEMTIGELAEVCGVPTDTVRYYMKRGLLAEPGRTRHGHRRFGADHLDKLRFVLRAKAHGFTLSEIAELWELLGDGATCTDLREAIDGALNRQQRVRDEASRAVDRLVKLRGSCECEGSASCLGDDVAEFVPDVDGEPVACGCCAARTGQGSGGGCGC